MHLHHRRRRQAAREAGIGPGHIACLPGRPHPRAMIHPIAAELGLELNGSPDRAAAVIFWQASEDSAFHSPPDRLLEISSERSVVNIDATDISKTTVARLSGEFFEDSLLIDPRSHRGPAVEKPEANGLRQARIVECPIEPVHGFCYQRLVDNRLDDGWTEDLRPVLIAGEVVCLIRKERAIEARLGNPTGGSRKPELHEPTDYLTEGEIGKVQELAGALGADYCEIDCLRDRNSGALHAVDVNTTPAMFDLLAPDTREALITIQARAFAGAYLSGSGG